MNKINIWKVIAILLLVFNISLAITVWLRNKYEVNNTPPQCHAEQSARITGRQLKHMLGFTHEQMDTFRISNHQFRNETNALINDINRLKHSMYEELQKTTPDTLYLNDLTKEIGEKHQALKSVTYHFYLSMKRNCDSTQKCNLGKLFDPMFSSECSESHYNTQQQNK